MNSTFNYFTSSFLSRLSEKRQDDEWIQNKLKDENTKIVLTVDLKLLVAEEPDIHSVFIRRKDIPEDIIPPEQFIFLGEKNHQYYFCVDISMYKELIDFALKLGQLKELRSIAAVIDREDAAILAYTRALIYWHKNNKYCGTCGSKMIIKDSGHKLVCSSSECGSESFPRTDPAVIMLVEIEDKCLLARQAKWPKGRYSTIAGFVEPGESLEQAVQREVYEETGVHIDNIKYHSSQPWPFPASIMLGFRVSAVSTEIKFHDRELEDAKWLTRKEIKSGILDGTMKLPFSISISFRLVEEWFDEGDEGKLSDLLSLNNTVANKL